MTETLKLKSGARACIPLPRDTMMAKREEYSQDVPVFEEHHLLCYFLGRRVTVKNAGLEVQGRLVRFEAAGRGGMHKPCMLLLLGDDLETQLLIRDWEEVKMT